MKGLIHICCAPCAVYPISCFMNNTIDIMGYFYNPNIHPFYEFDLRKQTLITYASQMNLRVIYSDEYPLEKWIQQVAFRENNRCRICYHDRLKSTAIVARRGKFDFFTSTLLYSKFQSHDLIREMGADLEKTYGIPFYYEDFRDGWKQGIELSKNLNLYRQQYCGCIYSEKERFYKKIRPDSSTYDYRKSEKKGSL
ncbi:MAG: epoxyqueuosine reductase QueH [Candidatus Magnetomorum sp.]|nr:epoxyqueuosine reductase QueH [Candidatus Magnetomorum sp.]